MAFSVSPAVTIREVDATSTLSSTASTKAAIAGVFRWGPVGERTLVTDETNLVSRFGIPTDFNAETFFVAADFLAYSNGLYVTRVIEDANTAATSDDVFVAKYPGALGNSLKVSYVTGTSSFKTTIFEANTVTANVEFGTTEIVFDYDPDIPVAVGDIIRLGNTVIGFQNLPVSSITEDIIDANTSTYTINSSTRYSLTADNINELKVERLWGNSGSIGEAPSANTFHLAVIDNDGTITGEAGSILELYQNISTDVSAKTEDGVSNYYGDILENQSSWISKGSAAVDTSVDSSSYDVLTGGTDGNGETGTPISFGAVALGYDLYRNSEVVDIAFILQGRALGGANATGVANYIIQNLCENRKDCMAFVSPSKASVVGIANEYTKLTNVRSFRQSLQNSSYMFVDSGYKYRYDKYNDKYRWVPLNGDMAGLAARVDPWVSPAGYKRGIIKNVVKLAFDPSKEYRDELYPFGINPVFTQSGQGRILLGDRTGFGDNTSAFAHINVRRLFIEVEKTIAAYARTILFDFNDSTTQAKFKNSVEPYLRDIQGRRGITDFRVVVDSRVNTPDVIDSQRFKGHIFIKPARSINFIELSFIATPSGIVFDELIGQNL